MLSYPSESQEELEPLRLSKRTLSLAYLLPAASPALAVIRHGTNAAIYPDQVTTTVISTLNTTITATASTALSITSTISTTSLTTATSVTTLSSTVMTIGATGAATAIPGFPWEAIFVGIILGIFVLGVLKRRRR